MTEEVYRNHYTTFLRDVVFALLSVVVLPRFLKNALGDTATLVVVLAVVLLITVPSLRALLLTKYVFTETGLTVCRNTLVQNKREINYNSLAHVSIKRDYWDRIFGTSKLCFNVNSSVNPGIPEVTLVLKNEQAAILHDRVNAYISEMKTDTVLMNPAQMHQVQKNPAQMHQVQKNPAQMHQVQKNQAQMNSTVQPMVEVSNTGIFVHSFLSQPSLVSLFPLFCLGMGILCLAANNEGGFAIGLVFSILFIVFPALKGIFQYGNYRLYRTGDTITIQSGIIATTMTSFEVEKINAVRMRAPVLARVAGMCTLEAEVVGVTDVHGIPLLCPLKKRAEIIDLFRKMLPEFYFENEPVRQDRRSLLAMASVSVPLAIAWFVLLFYGVKRFAPSIIDATASDSLYLTVGELIVANTSILAVIGALIILVSIPSRYKMRSIMMDRSMFMIGYGVFDLLEDYFAYDRIQISAVCSGPIQRKLGLSVLCIKILASSGSKPVRSGLFDEKCLERVPDTMIARIRDGRSGYRKRL